MQIKSILALGLVGTTFASPLLPRDGPAISDASSKIGSALTDLDNAVLALTQDAVLTQSEDLLAKAEAVTVALNGGAETVRASPQLTQLQDAITNLLVAAPLALQGVTVVGDIVQKKEILKGAGLTEVVVEQLNANKQATGNFVNALLSNLPSSITGLLSSIGLSDTSALVGSIFDVGIQQFQSDAPPPDLSAAGGSSTAASLGALAGAFGIPATGATGGTGAPAGGAGGLGALLGGLGGATGGAGGLGSLLGGLAGGSSSGSSGLGGLGGLAGLGGLLGGSRGGSGTTTSNPLAGLFGGSRGSSGTTSSNPLAGLLGGSSSGSNPLAGLLGGLRPPTPIPSARVRL